MPSRRSLIAGLLLAAGAAAASAQEKPVKVSQAQCRYQDKPKGIQSCALCAVFVKPDLCKVVEGRVSPDGWCTLFDLMD